MNMAIYAAFIAAVLHGAHASAEEDRRGVARVFQKLKQRCEIDFVGHPTSFGAIPLLISSEEEPSWNIATVVDEAALFREGRRLDDIVLGELRASGVSRRSWLRFVLDSGGLGYYVKRGHIVVTTRQMARLQWLTQLDKPSPQALESDSLQLRRESVFAAGHWRLNPDDWVVRLTALLRDDDRDVAFDAAYALGEFGSQSASAVDELIGLVKSKNLTLREAAVSALAKIGPGSARELTALVDDPDVDIAVAATKTIRLMGSVAEDSVLELISAGRRRPEPRELREGLAMAIAAIGRGDAVTRVRKLLAAESPLVRAFAAHTIGAFGPRGQSCSDELMELLADESPEVRYNAAFALAHLDLPPDTPTAALESAARDSHRPTSLWAGEAIRVIRSKQ